MVEKRKLANLLGYRGKLEKFDVDKAKAAIESRKSKPKKNLSWGEQVEVNEAAVERRKSNSAQANEPRPTLDQPTHKNQNEAKPTPQRNEFIWNEAIFAVDVILRELDQVTTFSPSYARLMDIIRSC